MKWWVLLWSLVRFAEVGTIPASLLYDYDVPLAITLPRGDDISSEEIVLKEPVIFFGINFETVYVNVNGFLSFQTDIPQFINIEFPLDYPIIAPFYTNVDTTRAGRILYYQTDNPSLIQRATENVHEAFVDHGDFQATNLLIITWEGVGYHKQGQDKVNTYQVVLITDGIETYVEFLYPENGLQWIQGTGDESGLPDARAQAGIISPDGKLFTLPGSGTEQVRNLEKWSNIGLEGQFIYKVDELEIVEPDNDFAGNKPPTTPMTCAEAPTFCHVQARCVDYDEGFCCKCNQNYYGNGRSCVKRDLPLRVNGKVHGKINGEKLEGLDLQSYIVMSDGRAYTAISKIPESIGYDIQSMQILGGVIGFLFAKPVRNAVNGYQITGGVFNHTATVRFLNTSQTVHIKEKYLGLDVFDQLRLEIDIQGDIPNLPDESRVTIDEYQEQYTLTKEGVIQMTAQKILRYNTPLGDEVSQFYIVDQTFVFDYCKYENQSIGETWKLKVGKNFISYESREQIIRFGLSNKIVPLGDFDPCEEGRSRCGENSACVVENESYRCVCNPGYQQFSSPDGRIACSDTNECQSGQHECDYNAQCINNIGSYSCQCNAGFEGNGFVCENSKSCFNVTCNENAECFEADGVASCRCFRGFTGNGHYCNPIQDHSCHVANNCSPYGYCAINPETNNYFCACLPGFRGDGYHCAEMETTTAFIPVTETETEPVVPTQRTVQTCLLGVCWCPSGYVLLKGTKYCVIYEGTTLPTELNTVTEIPDPTCDVVNNCHRNASCVYSDVTHEYSCICNVGFEGDGYSCDMERVSCAVENNCHQHATCLYDDHLGRSKCVCNPGYAGDGFACVITAICTSEQDCAVNEDCRLTSTQRYECVCKDGYVRDSQHHCVAVKGSCGGGTCVQNAECLYDDSYQIYYCSCRPGFVGDGIVECKEKIVGCDTLNNCGEHATCRYKEESLSYKCECNEGFFGDGTSCYAERNCHTDPKMCDPNAACLTDASRRFRCQCNTGYVGNGEVCKEISQHEGNFLLVNQGMATLKIPLDPSKSKAKRPIQVRPFQTAVGLDADCLVGRVYWSDISGKAIRSSLFNGSDKVDFIKDAIGSPEGLAIDWVSRNIYWTDSTLDTIEVANLDSKRRRTLFNTGLVNPRGIAVHPQRGKIFWSDWDRKNPKIERANADGTGREVFLQGRGISLPNSLTIDYETEELCYADAGTKSIECVNLDSKERQTIAVNCSYPFGIAVTDKEIYWSDWISKQIERVDKFNLNRLASLTIPVGGTGNKLFGLVAVPNTCPPLTNVCQHNKNQCPAEHICLPNGYGSRQCLCAYKSDAPNEKTNCIL